NFPLVGNRDRKAAQATAEGPSLSFQQAELVQLGFPCDHWLPVELARKWHTPVFPLARSTESVEQWHTYMKESVSFARIASQDKNAANLEHDRNNDVEV